MYLRALSTLRGLSGAPEVPPLCRETQITLQVIGHHITLKNHVELAPDIT